MANSRKVTRENRYRVLSDISFRNALSLDEHLRNMSGSERSLALNADQPDTFNIFRHIRRASVNVSRQDILMLSKYF